MDEPLQKAYIHTEPAVRCRSKQRPGVSMGGGGGFFQILSQTIQEPCNYVQRELHQRIRT